MYLSLKVILDSQYLASTLSFWKIKCKLIRCLCPSSYLGLGIKIINKAIILHPQNLLVLDNSTSSQTQSHLSKTLILHRVVHPLFLDWHHTLYCKSISIPFYKRKSIPLWERPLKPQRFSSIEQVCEYSQLDPFWLSSSI